LLIGNADDFYTSMAEMTQEMLDGSIVDADDLIKVVTLLVCIRLLIIASWAPMRWLKSVLKHSFHSYAFIALTEDDAV
jgi:hypothetical protein